MELHHLSPFLAPGPVSQPNSLAVLHLRRVQLLPTRLRERDEVDQGYDEGPVTNTRFGSFPHSTLIGLPWGSQVRASLVDTGSRGRPSAKAKKEHNKKRKREAQEPGIAGVAEDESNETHDTQKAPIAASTGFIHLLPPTVESWTASLPHRTQVVYTPDYSYIIHRLRLRPGSVIIEAGAGSGSFSHAAARAVYNGHPRLQATDSGSRKQFGKVWSYEFHEQRVEKLKAEIVEHGLEDVVDITHRDVYADGFLLNTNSASESISPRANTIFLDLPAPWLALRHLTRTPASDNISDSANPAFQKPTPDPSSGPSPHDAARTRILTGVSEIAQEDSPFISALNPDVTVRICTFSPCIEQVTRTISTLRELGWVDIEVMTLAQKRIEVRRERLGTHEESHRGARVIPATVEEAVEKLKESENRLKSFRAQINADKDNVNGDPEVDADIRTPVISSAMNKETNGSPAISDRKAYKEGRLIHRAEPELKTHTSYLVFAILPRQWTAEDEEKAMAKWPVRSDCGKEDRTTTTRKISGS